MDGAGLTKLLSTSPFGHVLVVKDLFRAQWKQLGCVSWQRMGPEH